MTSAIVWTPRRRDAELVAGFLDLRHRVGNRAGAVKVSVFEMLVRPRTRTHHDPVDREGNHQDYRNESNHVLKMGTAAHRRKIASGRSE